MHITSLQSASIDHAVENGRGLAITWSDGIRSFFHFVWLRDCCYCEVCGDCDDSLREFVPCEMPDDLRPIRWSVTPDDVLRIEWHPDSHVSQFAGEWLHAHRYDDDARPARRAKPVLWDSSLDAKRATFDFQAVSAHDEDRISMYRAVRDLGVAVIRNGPREPRSVIKVASLVGHVSQSAYGDVFDLKPGGTAGTAGTTRRAIVPHTDEPFSYAPPGILTLACVNNARDGGDTVLVDGFHLAEQLRQSFPDGFQALVEWNHCFVRRHSGTFDQRARVPMISLDDDGMVCGIRLHTRSSGPLCLPEEVTEFYYSAYRNLSAAMMDADNQVRVSLEPGDAVIFDNHRILHARTAFSDQDRFFQVCAVSREHFHERCRILAAALGHAGEADLILSPGAVR